VSGSPAPTSFRPISAPTCSRAPQWRFYRFNSVTTVRLARATPYAGRPGAVDLSPHGEAPRRLGAVSAQLCVSKQTRRAPSSAPGLAATGAGSAATARMARSMAAPPGRTTSTTLRLRRRCSRLCRARLRVNARAVGPTARCSPAGASIPADVPAVAPGQFDGEFAGPPRSSAARIVPRNVTRGFVFSGCWTERPVWWANDHRSGRFADR